MIKNYSKQTGSAHVVIIVILAIAILGVLGFVFWNNFIKKDPIDSKSTSSNSSKVDTSKPEVTDSTSNWKTTRSPLTGYTIKYPNDWILVQGSGTGEEILTNIKGGKSFNVTLVNRKSDGTPTKLPTARYMCVVINDYTGTWSRAPRVSKEPAVSSFQPNSSTTLNIVTIPRLTEPDISMLSQMYATTASGDMEIPLSTDGWLSISSSFNCTQGDSDALKASNDMFMDQPETKKAESIIKTLRF